jgi:hypothetical protein
VIQYVRQSAALDETPSLAPREAAVRRLAFFGQLREGKGIRIFLAALDALEPNLLDGRELLFLGSDTARWRGDRIVSALEPGVKEHLSAISVHTTLDREEALEELRRPGTLAVMPSLLDNSPNTVSECIEYGIPFVTTRTGGIPELVAEEDRARVLCEPTSDGLAAALTRALADGSGFAPARAAREAQESLEAWLAVVDSVAPPARAGARAPTHVSVVAKGEDAARRAHRLAQNTQTVDVEVVPAQSRHDGFARTAADWVVFLDDEDSPDEGLVDALVAAQVASGADLVTAAVRPADDPGGIQLFLGNPGALGLVENQYGVLGLLRSELAAAEPLSDGAVDADWPLFARVALAGARIVSIPEPLSTHDGKPGRVGDVPGEGLDVLAAFEQRRGAELQDLPQLAATLAAANLRLDVPGPDPLAPSSGRRAGARIRRILRGG